MTLFLVFPFLYALVLGIVPPNSNYSSPVVGEDDFLLHQQNRASAALDPSPTTQLVSPEAPTPEVFLATHVNPTQTDCRTDCVVGLPAATVYKWQQVTITSTITVQTITHVVNPESFPLVTGTIRSYEYTMDQDEAKRDRYSLDKEDGVVVTTLDLGYRLLPVTFPTPITVTPTTLTLVGGPPATVSQETPACTPAVVQSVNLTTPESAKLFAFGDVEGSNEKASTSNWGTPAQPNKSVKDTIHWRLVPESYRQVDVVQFRNQFPYIMALDVCGAFGPPDQPASITQLMGNAWVTATVTSTVTGNKDPRVQPLINLSKKPGTSLDGPGARPTDGVVHPLTVHQEQSAQAMSLTAQKSGIALPMMTQEPANELAGQLVGPAPKPSPTQQRMDSGVFLGPSNNPSAKPAIGGQIFGSQSSGDQSRGSQSGRSQSNSGQSSGSQSSGGRNNGGQSSGGYSSSGSASESQNIRGNKKAAPLVVNGHTFTPKGLGTWETDDGQILEAGGSQIELDNSSDGEEHKMTVSLDSDSDGNDVLVVDGASMTLREEDLLPAATGSSWSGGRSGRGSTSGSSSDDRDLSSGSRSGIKAGGDRPAQYTGSAQRASLSWTLCLTLGFFGTIVFL